MQEITTLPSLGVTSIKLFMAYKGVLQIDDTTLFKSMQLAKQSGVLTMVHAENGDAIDVLIQQAIADKNMDPIYHALTRPAELEAEATSRAIQLARAAGDAPLFVVHLTNAGALAAITDARARGQHAFAETCVQYLYFTKDDMRGSKTDKFNGAKYVCSPPFREKSDQLAIRRGLRMGDLHSVSTDHCPFNYKGQKSLGKGNFAKIPNGVPGIEDRMMLLWDAMVNTGEITPSKFVELTSTAPAKMFGMYPRKGTLSIGADADIVIWDPKRRHVHSVKTHHMNIDYNLYEGIATRGGPTLVFSRGELVVDGDKWLGSAGRGRFIQRGPAQF
jgi:dihydropyrimidinase